MTTIWTPNDAPQPVFHLHIDRNEATWGLTKPRSPRRSQSADSDESIQAAFNMVRLSRDTIAPPIVPRRKPLAVRDAAVRFVAERGNNIDVRRDAAAQFSVDRRTIARWCDAVHLDRTYVERREKRRIVLEFIRNNNRSGVRAEASRKFHVSAKVIILWCRIAGIRA